MRRLELGNRLMQELMERGTEPAEAHRLAALAEAISQIQPAIDPNFADSVETLLLRERPGEALAKIIAITRNRDAEAYREQSHTKPHALPATDPRRVRPRLVIRLAVAAAVILFGIVGIPRLVKGAPDFKTEVQPPPSVPGNGQAPTSPGARKLTSPGASIHWALRSNPVRPRPGGVRPPVEISDPSSEACPVTGSKSLKAGRKSLSINCPSAYNPAGDAPRVQNPPSS